MRNIYKFHEVFCDLDGKTYSVEDLQKMENDEFNEKKNNFYCPNYDNEKYFCRALLSIGVLNKRPQNRNYKRILAYIRSRKTSKHKIDCSYRVIENNSNSNNNSQYEVKPLDENTINIYLNKLVDKEISKSQVLKQNNNKETTSNAVIDNSKHSKNYARISSRKPEFHGIKKLLDINFDLNNLKNTGAYIIIKNALIKYEGDTISTRILHNEDNETSKDYLGNDLTASYHWILIKDEDTNNLINLKIGWYWYHISMSENEWQYSWLLKNKNKEYKGTLALFVEHIKRNKNKIECVLNKISKRFIFVPKKDK